ncbi:MAG: urate oxidase [Actinobacteria bacterium]|nr:urate oxidase [Actinomycetota bacterium]
MGMGANSYGKDGIRLVTVARLPDRHEVRELTVDVRLEGDFARVYTAGDNSPVLPTDTMRTTVYALAHDHPLGDIERFGATLAERFLTAAPAASLARIRLVEHPWVRVEAGGRGHPHAFSRSSGERWTATVAATRSGLRVGAGLEGLVLLKTTGSGFAGFLKDRYTVLEETDDRLLATEVSATWRYASAEADFPACRRKARRALVEAFADHDSRSLQHTLWAMGQAVLRDCGQVERVSLSLPNRHHFPVDLSPFGQTNDDEVFVAVDRPYGVIEGAVERPAGTGA